MYSIILTDRSYAPVAEVRNVSNFSYMRALNKLATVSFQVRLDNAQVDRLSSVDGFIKVYRNNALRFVGPIVTAEETAERETQSLAVTAADTGWFLTKRINGQNSVGTLWTTPTARHTIAKTLIDNTNTGTDTGVSTTDPLNSSGSAITYKVGPYAQNLAAIQEVGGALDGFDWIMEPIENWVNGAVSGTKTATFKARTVIGTSKPNVVFEYGVGTRSNVLSYNKTTTRDGQANRVFHVGSDASNVVVGVNAAAQTLWGLQEDVVSADITDSTMRQKLVDEHVAVRGNPRTLIQMTPHIDPGAAGRVPEAFVEYDVGDTIQFRAVHAKKVRFAGTVRVYGIKTSLDPTGFERVELILEDE